MDTLIKDIRHGIRSLTNRPGFTAIAIITLALGIGASTAIFSVVDGVLLRPLPYPNSEQIVQLCEVNSKGVRIAFAEPNFLDVRARSHTLEAAAQYGGELTAEECHVAGFNWSSNRSGWRLCNHPRDGKFIVRSGSKRSRNFCGRPAGFIPGCFGGVSNTRATSDES